MISEPADELQERKNKFQWMEQYDKTFDVIKQLLITPLVLSMLTGNNKFKLESKMGNTTAEEALF